MLATKEVVNLDGDGPCDSQGPFAKYGTYTLMDDDTGNVVAFNVVEVTEVTLSNAIWRRQAFPGTEKCLKGMMSPATRLQETDMRLSAVV